MLLMVNNELLISSHRLHLELRLDHVTAAAFFFFFEKKKNEAEKGGALVSTTFTTCINGLKKYVSEQLLGLCQRPGKKPHQEVVLRK